MRRLLLIAVLFAALPMASAAAGTSCDLQGAWQLVSAKYDNQAAPSTLGSIKIFTKTHFTAVGLDKTWTATFVTDSDRLNFLSNLIAVAGTYSVSADAWTEKIEYFSDPDYIGLSLTFQCIQEGDNLIQKGMLPIFDKGKKVRDISLEEVYRRVERP